MSISPKSLVVKTSTIPGSGKGLFTKKPIPKGTRIIEYTGKVTTWKEADNGDGENGYIYYVKRNFVIDARPFKKSLARYANDAKGLNKIKGFNNNCEYVEEGTRVFIHAKKDIPAGAEILVPYGPEYWQVIRHNKKINEHNRKIDEAAAKAKTSSETSKKASNTSGKTSKTSGRASKSSKTSKTSKTSRTVKKNADQLKAVKPGKARTTGKKSKSAKAGTKVAKRIASAPKGNLEAA